MIFLDTTVLMYAVGTTHTYREPCRELVRQIRDGRLSATTTVEAIQEFAHVFARRRRRADAAAAASDFADLLTPLRLTESDHLRHGLKLWAAQERLGAFDAVLAAVALDTKYRIMVSADRAFAGVPGLDHVLPDADGVASLIG